jgi:hypothetical protein
MVIHALGASLGSRGAMLTLMKPFAYSFNLTRLCTYTSHPRPILSCAVQTQIFPPRPPRSEYVHDCRCRRKAYSSSKTSTWRWLWFLVISSKSCQWRLARYFFGTGIRFGRPAGDISRPPLISVHLNRPEGARSTTDSWVFLVGSPSVSFRSLPCL